MWKASPPLAPTRANQAVLSSLSRRDVNASSWPSGLQAGAADSSVGDVKRHAGA